jgi:HAD superfamily hydrolase (TIGR01509 family)
MWEAALFDFDGTIVNSEAENIEILAKVLAQYDIELNKNQKQWFASHSWKDCIDKIKCDYPYMAKVELFKEINDLLHLSVPPLLPGVTKALEVMNYNCKLAVVSGSDENLIKRILSSHGLLTYFELIIGQKSSKESKPSPKPYLTSAELLGVLPQKCIVFEDSEIGLQSAVKANMCACAVEIGNEFQQNLQMSFCKIPSFEHVEKAWLLEIWKQWSSTR